MAAGRVPGERSEQHSRSVRVQYDVGGLILMVFMK